MRTLLPACLFFLLVFPLSAKAWRRRRSSCSFPVPCSWHPWSSWSQCNHECGNEGFQFRARSKMILESCGGFCDNMYYMERPCNRFCNNGGTPKPGYCSCPPGWTGFCCEYDVNECESSPCQHNCTNTPGSYRCSCRDCYTQVGNTCDLRQCIISGKCYREGAKNPSNPCQDCNKFNTGAWTNNDALPCDDRDACTRADRCSAGTCTGTPYICGLHCQFCDDGVCKTKPNWEVVRGLCVDLTFCRGRKRGHYQDPRTPDHFYQCDAFYRAFLLTCPNGTRWSIEKHTCDYKANVPWPRKVSANPDNFCKGKTSGIHAYPNKCKKFILCSNQKTYIMKCPPGLNFNINVKTCDWPSNAPCIR